MNEQEIVLGFHVRVSPESLPPWSPERRKQFLLRENIRLPLGVDHSVWPLIEEGDPLPNLFDDYVDGTPQNSLHIFLSTSIEHIDKCSKGTVTVLTASPEEAGEIKRWGKLEEASLSLPTLREHGFVRLGFDVADRDAMWSVLNNTDPGETERAKLATQFGALLDDEFGLFAEWESANQYRETRKVIWISHGGKGAGGGWKEWLYVYGVWSKPLTTRFGATR